MIYHCTLQQIRLFEAVARCRSYTRAAEELHLSQPAVHIQVKRLEESMGLPLIEQSGKKLLLTHAGEEVYEAALDVLNRLQSMTSRLSDMKGRVAGPVKVGAVESSKFFIPELLGRFLREFPEVHPQLTVTNRAHLVERLLANQDDFVIMGEVAEHAALTVTPFMENLLVPIAHPDHPLAKKKNISLDRFASESFLIREQGSGTRAATERLFSEHGLKVSDPHMELGSNETVKQGVMAGLGVSVLSHSSLALELEMGRVVVLDVKGFPLRRMWYATHLKGKKLGLTAGAFLDFLVREGNRSRKSKSL